MTNEWNRGLGNEIEGPILKELGDEFLRTRVEVRRGVRLRRFNRPLLQASRSGILNVVHKANCMKIESMSALKHGPEPYAFLSDEVTQRVEGGSSLKESILTACGTGMNACAHIQDCAIRNRLLEPPVEPEPIKQIEVVQQPEPAPAPLRRLHEWGGKLMNTLGSLLSSDEPKIHPSFAIETFDVPQFADNLIFPSLEELVDIYNNSGYEKYHSINNPVSLIAEIALDNALRLQINGMFQEPNTPFLNPNNNIGLWRNRLAPGYIVSKGKLHLAELDNMVFHNYELDGHSKRELIVFEVKTGRTRLQQAEGIKSLLAKKDALHRLYGYKLNINFVLCLTEGSRVASQLISDNKLPVIQMPYSTDELKSLFNKGN